MQIENVPITKGPDKWLLAESLFHDDEYPEDVVHLSFTVQREGKDFRLSLRTMSISKLTESEGVYEITGVANVRTTGANSSKILEHVPVKISYSVHNRKGIANVNF